MLALRVGYWIGIRYDLEMVGRCNHNAQQDEQSSEFRQVEPNTNESIRYA